MHILQLEQMTWVRVKVSGGFPAEPRASFSYGLSGKIKNINKKRKRNSLCLKNEILNKFLIYQKL
jgi:hypothetical protein